jgi:pimeloyl-ACP methyl ester carboxylesterase
MVPSWIFVADEGSGPAVVLLHGYALSAASWDPVAERMRDRARIIRPDLRGFARSSPGEGPYTMERMAEDVAAILDERRIERATIVGHSMGGVVAMAFARAFPQRVAGIALVDSRVDPDTPEQERNRLSLAERAKNEGLGVIEASYVPKFFAPRVYEERADLVEAAHRGFADHDNASAAAAFAGSVRRFDGRAVLASLDVPAHVLCGDQDAFFTVASQQRLVAAARDGEIAVIPGCGHMPMWEAPDETAAALLRLVDRVVAVSRP